MILTWPLSQDVTHPTGLWHNEVYGHLKEQLQKERQVVPPVLTELWILVATGLLRASSIRFLVGTVQVLSVWPNSISVNILAGRPPFSSLMTSVPLESRGYFSCYSRAKETRIDAMNMCLESLSFLNPYIMPPFLLYPAGLHGNLSLMSDIPLS